MHLHQLPISGLLEGRNGPYMDFFSDSRQESLGDKDKSFISHRRTDDQNFMLKQGLERIFGWE
jgi:hypothetical protein